MAWDFSTDPEFQAKLDWARDFVREEIWPIETVADELGQPRSTASTRRCRRRSSVRGCGRAICRRNSAARGTAR